ncbi:MAG: hypothetical protein USCAAHI_01393 [Beijerinckiaceae bacterium]|nr:MAG: hypothetical protein USCAAHI_01393 [Beijerinckiaceae bacterium]
MWRPKSQKRRVDAACPPSGASENGSLYQGASGLKLLDGIRLFNLPPCGPGLRPVETNCVLTG